MAGPSTLDDGAIEERLKIERRGITAIRAALVVQLAAALNGIEAEPGAEEQAVEQLEEASQPLLDAITAVLLAASLKGVEIGNGQLETIGLAVDWTLVNEAARQWVLGVNPAQVGGYAKQLYDQVQITSKRTLRQELAAWITNGEPLRGLEKRLEPTFGRRRAELIASTEVTRAYAEGNRMTWRESGVVDEREWRASADERVCPVCGPLHKKRAALEASFDGGVDNPPAHPRCRCWIVPVVRRRQ